MKILIGMSGGVDSAVAAKRLKSEGHEVEGAVLKMHEYTEIEDAILAAEAVGIPIHVIDCTELFNREVKSYLVNEYVGARTPNPCIVCNEKVKFKALYDFAKEHGFDKIATGHYASISEKKVDGEQRLAISFGTDAGKDQSYMLYRLPQHVLDMLVFPLASAEKNDVKIESCELGLDLESRPESQEICFLPDGDHPSFVESRAGKCPEGNFINESGTVLGKHKGIIRYTVGQRKGLGIALGERMFVTAIDSGANTVTLANSPAKAKKVIVENLIFSGIVPLIEDKEYRLRVKLRYLAKPVFCVVTIYKDGFAEAILDDFATSVTPGQSAVFYEESGNIAFGGFIRFSC